MKSNQEDVKQPERGRFLNAVVQIRLEHDPSSVPWAALPLFEGQLELALTWMRNNHGTLVAMLEGSSS